MERLILQYTYNLLIKNSVFQKKINNLTNYFIYEITSNITI